MLKRSFAIAVSLALTGLSPAFSRERTVLPDVAHPTHYDLVLEPDIEKAVFKGRVSVDLQLLRPTKTITLNAAELKFDKVALVDGQTPESVRLDEKAETATLTFPKELAVGACTLQISYSGVIHQHATGLFYLDYEAQGKRQRALFTQLENSDARRLLPCWDEPNQKATFTLSARVPSQLMAISNMPVIQGDGDLVHFATSPKMSSYLLFFGLGDFERVSQMVEGIDLGIVVKRGDRARAAYALDAATHLLPYLNDYFGYKYPLPKMDLLAGPGSSQFFGAMENWGALFYFERDLLVDASVSTQADKQNVYLVIAHEMSHQWFGDLVTMDWWDDLWLNEGFASWLEVKATDHFHPEWHLPLRGVTWKQGAMALDARQGTHPVIQPILDVLQASQAFDSITYAKGKAVIGMLEAYVGEAAFRDGVRNYIRKHAYGNAVTDDLWNEIDAVSPRKVTQVAHDFTRQAGVPLLRVKRQGEGVIITQDRFGLDASGRVPAHWLVPVQIAQTVETVDGSLSVAGQSAVVNQGQNGYFRTLYEGALFAQMSGAFSHLATIDQLGILEDIWALGVAGYAPISNALDLLAQLPVEGDPVLLTATVNRFASLDDLEVDLPGRAALHRWGLPLLRPLARRLGWDPRAGEDDNTTELRVRVLDVLSLYDASEVVAEARRRFAAFLSHPAGVNPTTRGLILGIVASHADSKSWEQIHDLARHAATSLEKLEYYRLLASPRDRGLAARALALAFSPELDASSGPAMIGGVAYRHPALAFDFAVLHLSELYARLEPDSRYRYLPRLVAGSHDLALLKRLQSFAQKNIPETARIAVKQAESSVAVTMQMRAQRVPEIDRWIKARGR